MNKITKAWTYGVAYLSLAVGSGVSISGNIADTYRVSGALNRVPDGLDIAISAFWPAAVLLAIEMFVSRLWPRTRPMQAVRWVGSLAIGFVTMYVSWHHLSDLMASRGQDLVVSHLGPLAIDGLAIMATGLILSSRGHKINLDSVRPVAGHVLTDQSYFATAEDVVESKAAFRGDVHLSNEDMLAASVRATSDEDMDMWTRLENEMAGQDSVPAVPVSAPPAVRPEGIPAAAVEAILTWAAAPTSERPTAGTMAELLASEHGVSTRQIRRWRQSVMA